MEKRPRVIAHRGASRLVAENSLEAFERAIALGVDGIEFDVRITSDNVMVVVHDDSVDGTLIRALTRAEIATLRPEIPTLEDVLALTTNRIYLDVELKERGYERQAVELITRYCDPCSFLVTSFNDESIGAIRRTTRDVTCGLLVGGRKPWESARHWLGQFVPVTRTRIVGADVLVAHWTLLRAGLLSRAARARIPVIVWTVDDVRWIQMLVADPRVAGVITNVPDVALAERARLQSAPT